MKNYKTPKESLLTSNEKQSLKRDFEEWFAQFRQDYVSYSYYTNFEKVYKNTEHLKKEIDTLNSLVGSKNIEKDFLELIDKHPEALKAIPILLATRENEIYCKDETGELCYDFSNKNLPDEKYAYFMRKTGLFDLLANFKGNLYEHVLCINIGLDSHARKNRGGTSMEKRAGKFIAKAGYVEWVNHLRQASISEIEAKFGIDLSILKSKAGEAEKVFDDVVFDGKTVFAIEENYFRSNGSKMNETARSYESIAKATEHLENFRFIWITDGMGWKKNKKILKKAFESIEMYNIHDLENGIIEKGFKQ